MKRPIGEYRQFGGRWYRLKAWSKSKAKLKARRWGGRILPLPKTHPAYAKGYRWGLYKEA